MQVTAGGEAAALWARPGAWRMPIGDIVRYTPRFVRLYRERLLTNLWVLQRLEAGHAREPHYYLAFLGTDPVHQGRGFGSQRVAPMAERADEEGIGLYLESSKEANLAFYHRFGFEVTERFELPIGGPPMWRMWRDPR